MDEAFVPRIVRGRSSNGNVSSPVVTSNGKQERISIKRKRPANDVRLGDEEDDDEDDVQFVEAASTSSSSSRPAKPPAKVAKMSDSPSKMSGAVLQRLAKEASSRRCDVTLTNVANSTDLVVAATYAAAKAAYDKHLRGKMLRLFPEDDRDRVEAMISEGEKVQATDGQQATPPSPYSHLQLSTSALVEVFQELDAARKQIEKLQYELSKEGPISTTKTSADFNMMSALLSRLKKPAADRTVSFHDTKGFRLLNMENVKVALAAAQKCTHRGAAGRLTLLELDPEVSRHDLASSFAFVCMECHRATIFPNSSFSEEIPENYSVNKQLMMAMGPTAYYKLANFVKNTQEDRSPLRRNPSLPAQFVFSTDHTKYGTVRDQPKDLSNGWSHSAASTSTQVKQAHNTYLPVVASKPRIAPPLLPTLPAFSSNGLPFRLPLPPNLAASALRPTLAPVALPTSTYKQPQVIKASADLPAGCRITMMPQGATIHMSMTSYSTPERTNLKPGVYKVQRDREPDRYLVVRAAANASSQQSLLRPLVSAGFSLPSAASVPLDFGGGGAEEDPLGDPLADPLATDMAMGAFGDVSEDGGEIMLNDDEDEDADDDPPDLANFLQMDLQQEGGDDLNRSMDSDAQSVSPVSNPGELEPDQRYVGWQDEADAGADPDVSSAYSDDSEDDDWGASKKRKRKNKNKGKKGKTTSTSAAAPTA